jgi:hypothetical protein
MALSNHGPAAAGNSMLEGFKLAGAIVAFVIALFTIWDRCARGRPLAWVTAEKFGVNPLEYIRIKNPGPGDLFILGVRAYPPTIYGVSRDRSSTAIADALSFKIDVNVLLGPGETRDLPIIDGRDPRISKDAPSRRVCFLIYWRKTSSSWLPQVPVPVITSTHDVQRIAAAATRRADVL